MMTIEIAQLKSSLSVQCWEAILQADTDYYLSLSVYYLLLIYLIISSIRHRFFKYETIPLSFGLLVLDVRGKYSYIKYFQH